MFFEMPVIFGEVGDKCFTLSDGRKTKTFHHSGKFDEFNGVFPIYDEEDRIVEYMDILGNFSKEKTEFAHRIYRFIFFERYSYLIARFKGCTHYECAINSFPSKFLTNKKVQELVIQIEDARFQKMKSDGQFVSVFEAIRYRVYMKRCLKEKLDRAKKLSQDMEVLKEVEEELVGFRSVEI